MNNKGFSLIEILAVIVILAIVGVITVSKVLGNINTSSQKAYSEQVTRILRAADNYETTHTSMLPNSVKNTATITISDLQTVGYLKSGDIKNPIDKTQNMVQTIKIFKTSSTDNIYKTVYCDTTYGQYYYTDADVFKTVVQRCSNSVFGDVNNDGVLNATDVNLVTSYINTGSSAYENRINIADGNFDGLITSDDVAILNLLVS